MTSAVSESRTVGFAPFILLTDLIEGISRVQLWLAFAADEIQQRYRRSKLGLAWIFISYLIFVGTISLFFGNFSELQHPNFTVYVAINFAIFTFLLSNITDGCAAFWVARSWIKSAQLPHSVHIYKSIARSLFVFSINFTIALIIFHFYGYRLKLVALEAIPALLLLLLDAVFLQIILGYICSRYRDIEHLIQSVTRILFFTTPVLWVRSEHMAPGLRNIIAEVNPLTHALEIFSTPILGQSADPYSWVFMLITSAVLFCISLTVSGFAYSRLPYWL